ncbi:MAG: ATP-dependent sacrificial sulfur transferase LarE [Candidatus Lokiarchaeota archaeon]|nr:ATP-dependent sacrificial sulfur transferase LarE [Candidatus Lokiarchaeota archaeon]
MNKEKFQQVRDRMRNKRVLVAFSGGVDSTVLAKLAEQSAKEVLLLNITMPTAPSYETAQITTVASEIDAPLKTVAFDWLEHEKLVDNTPMRCYQCKLEIGRLWLGFAKEQNMDMVVEGTTATEVKGHRPGAKALSELEIVSPFLEAGITKQEIREFAAEHNLSIADAPSMACLASRFPSGVRITKERLEKVDQLENEVRLIFKIECVRVRYHGEIARIEVGKDERHKLFDTEKLDLIHESGKDLGFRYVVFDVIGYRTGSTS